MSGEPPRPGTGRTSRRWAAVKNFRKRRRHFEPPTGILTRLCYHTRVLFVCLKRRGVYYFRLVDLELYVKNILNSIFHTMS